MRWSDTGTCAVKASLVELGIRKGSQRYVQVAAKGSFPVADDSPTSRAILGVSECNGLWVLKKSLP